jgi:hypothetical protein
MGKQSAQGTAATVFSLGRMNKSNTTPRWLENEAKDEHIGVNERATAEKSAGIRIGYSVPISAGWRLYPNMIGDALLLAGFKVSTTGPTDTAAYTHVFTLADRDELLWGSVYHAIGEGTVGSGRYARTIKDVRLSSLAINASHRNGISVEAAGLGIQDAASAAGPTLNAEPDAALNPATGSLTVTGLTYLGTPQNHIMTLNNPLGEEEGQLHTPFLQDLPLTGATIAGQMQGIPWTELQWKELLYASGVAPSTSTLALSEARLQWNFTSGGLITGAAATKYSMAFDIAVATVTLDTVDVSGSGKLKVNAAYKMIDRSSSAPITITLINGKASY